MTDDKKEWREDEMKMTTWMPNPLLLMTYTDTQPVNYFEHPTVYCDLAFLVKFQAVHSLYVLYNLQISA